MINISPIASHLNVKLGKEEGKQSELVTGYFTAYSPQQLKNLKCLIYVTCHNFLKIKTETKDSFCSLFGSFKEEKHFNLVSDVWSPLYIMFLLRLIRCVKEEAALLG
uniref:Uncharacterized protein n=1 Tax=Pygocentrus nattereri TaxID=42514 RepID=A0AAR2KBN2_PYGNA